MQLNNPAHWAAFKWYLEFTEMCHSRNFVACWFVSDWRSNTHHASMFSGFLSNFSNTKPYPLAKLAQVECPQFWTGMHECFCHTLQHVRWVRNVKAVLFLADDTLVLRPWRVLRRLFQQQDSLVVPGIFPSEDVPFFDLFDFAWFNADSSDHVW